MTKHKRTLRKGRGWRVEIQSQQNWSLTRYSQPAQIGAQRCYKNHPSVYSSIAFDTLKWRAEYFCCLSTFQGVIQMKCSRNCSGCKKSGPAKGEEHFWNLSSKDLQGPAIQYKQLPRLLVTYWFIYFIKPFSYRKELFYCQFWTFSMFLFGHCPLSPCTSTWVPNSFS